MLNKNQQHSLMMTLLISNHQELNKESLLVHFNKIHITKCFFQERKMI